MENMNISEIRTSELVFARRIREPNVLAARVYDDCSFNIYKEYGDQHRADFL